MFHWRDERREVSSPQIEPNFAAEADKKVENHYRGALHAFVSLDSGLTCGDEVNSDGFLLQSALCVVFLVENTLVFLR
jgi:hypothetical protein